MADAPTTYWGYIKVEQLLGLQGGLGDDEGELSNDEVLFITIHQIDELWFKLAVRELASLRDCFAQDPVPEQALAQVARSLKRVTSIFLHAAEHFALMETMTTRDYLAFRDKLAPASGFQSAQLREIEILLGLKDTTRLPLGNEASYLEALRSADGSASPALKRVLARLEGPPSIAEVLQTWLYRTPICGSEPGAPGDAKRVGEFIASYLAAHGREVEQTMALALARAANDGERERLQARYRQEMADARTFLRAEDVPAGERAQRCRVRAAVVFIESYRELPLLAWPREVLDAVVALEQSFLVFRQRHARMVERVIGRRTGTGGSAGVEYLDQTALRYRVFTDLWAARTLLLRRDGLPPLAETDFYEFFRGH